MKICFISNSVTWFTGFSQQTKILAQEFHNRGHEVFNLCERRVEGDTPYITEISFHNFSIEAYDRELFRIKPDVVIVLDGYNRNFNCANLTYTGHCKFFFWFPYESIVPLHDHREQFKNCPEGSVVFTSEFTRNIWNHVPGPVIPHSIDDVLFEEPNKENGLALRKQMGIPDVPIVFNINRNEVRKRWDNFFKVVKELVNFPSGYIAEDFKVVVHTNQAGYYNFKQLLDYYDLNDRVIFTDFEFTKGLSKTDFRDLFSTFDLRIDTSSSEGFGLVVAEMAALGIAQWVGEHTCMNELLPNYPKFPVNGMYVSQSRNMYSEFDFVFPLVTEENIREAKEHVKRYNTKSIADQWESLFEQTTINPKYKWGFNGSESMGAGMMAAATFCGSVGGKIVEYGTQDGKFVDCCLYLGLDVVSVDNGVMELSERTKSVTISPTAKFTIPKGNILVATDFQVPPIVLKNYNWLIIRKKLNHQEIPEGFHRRTELESAMVARDRSFRHEIYSKDSTINPLGNHGLPNRHNVLYTNI